MATTTKTLTPTNQTITIPDMTERPNVSLLTDGIGKEADAINALNSKVTNMNNLNSNVNIASVSVGNATWTTLAQFTPTKAGNYLIETNMTFGAGSGIRVLLVDAAESQTNTSANSVLSEGRATLQKMRMVGLTTSDTIYIRVYQNSGSAMDIGGSYRVLFLG